MAVTAAKESRIASEPLRVSLAQHLLGLSVMVLGGGPLFAFLLDLAGLPVRPWTVWPLVLVIIALFGWNYLRQGKRGLYDLRTREWAELAVFLAIVAGVLVYTLWLARPGFVPVGTTVDAVHQYGLADYISQSGKLPIHATDQRPNLQDGLEYPPAFVTIASLLSQTSGIGLIYLLYPLAAFFVALAAGVTFLLANRLLAGKPWRLPLAALAAGATLFPYDYTFGSVTSQNYFAQVMAQALLLLTLYYLLLWREHPNPETLGLFGLSVAGLLICYPTWAAIPLAGFGLVALLNKGNQTRAKLINLAVIFLPLGLLAVLFLKDRLKAGLGTVANEGNVALPDLARYSWPVVILAALGLGIALWKGALGDKILALFCGLVALEGVGFWALKSFANTGSYYSVYKLFYPAAFLLPLLAALGWDWLLAKIPHFQEWFKGSARQQAGLVAAALILPGCLLALTWFSHPEPERPYPVITRDGYRVARWMEQNLKITEYSVSYAVRPGTPAYWLQVGIFKQPRDHRTNDLLFLEPSTFAGWFYTPDSTDYLYIEDIRQANLDERVQVLYQSGNAAVLTRTAAYKEQFGQRPALTIQYKAELSGTVLYLTTEATMTQEPSSWLSIGIEIESANGGLPVFRVFAPAEYNRARKQYIGATVRLPSLQVKELYANNNFPPTPPAVDLTPGQYRAFLVLRKNDTAVERRKLQDFTFNGGSDLQVSADQKVMTGQFLFEGTLPATLPEISTVNLSLNGEQFKLDGLKMPDSGHMGETVQVDTRWQPINPSTRSYHLRWVWLDNNMQVAASSDTLPLNGLYPTWMWPISSPTVIHQGIKLPNKAGRYRLGVELVDQAENATSQVYLDKFIEVS